MRSTQWLGLTTLIVIALTMAVISYRKSRKSTQPHRTHIVLIGASIGQAWRLARWPARMGRPGFSAESLAEWQFDKTETVEAVLLRPASRFAFSRAYLQSLAQPPEKPGLVIIKECSSYFPGPLPAYQDSLRSWVERLQEHRLPVMLATVVPITRARAARDPGKQESLLAFNAWLRDYARQQHLAVLDLEAALGRGSDQSYLRDELAAPDGSHLNAAAYKLLDAALLETLCGAAPACNQAVASSPAQ